MTVEHPATIGALEPESPDTPIVGMTATSDGGGCWLVGSRSTPLRADLWTGTGGFFIKDLGVSSDRTLTGWLT